LANLGPHHAESRLVLTSGGPDNPKVVSEEYELRWDNWGQYQYRVKKGNNIVMDVTVWGGKGFQRQSDGRIRKRERPDELNYYLRQTWNQWHSAINQFKQVLIYQFERSGDLEGRPVDKYLLTLKRRVEPGTSGRNRLRQSIEHDKLEGAIWIDRTTKVPLQAVLQGEYRVVRFSRRPGAPGEEAHYKIDFKLRRYNIGRQQLTEPPETLALP